MATHKVDLSFWEYAAVLERRLADKGEAFAMIVREFKSHPNAERLTELNVQAEELLHAAKNLRDHAGTARCEPIPKEPDDA